MIARKCFGQNFLKNPYILNQIKIALLLEKNDSVLEVGPGPSFLTRLLVPEVKQYFAVEIDKQFKTTLESIHQEYPHFTYIINDFLSISMEPFFDFSKFVGNLPYNISTPILYKIASETRIGTLVCMFAEGSADRFLAKPASKNYSAGSILVQSFFTVEKILFVSRSQFNPPPKIDSIVLRFKRKEGDQKETIAFNHWIQPLFSYRRKTITNALTQILKSKDKTQSILQKSGIPGMERIENLSISELQKMFLIYRNECNHD